MKKKLKELNDESRKKSYMGKNYRMLFTSKL